MPKSDLSTPEGRAAYGRELSQVARPWRWVGLSLVVVSMLLTFWNRSQGGDLFNTPLALVADTAFVVGWGLAIVAIVKRTRYHHRRMAESEG